MLSPTQVMRGGFGNRPASSNRIWTRLVRCNSLGGSRSSFASGALSSPYPSTTIPAGLKPRMWLCFLLWFLLRVVFTCFYSVFVAFRSDHLVSPSSHAHDNTHFITPGRTSSLFALLKMKSTPNGTYRTVWNSLTRTFPKDLPHFDEDACPISTSLVASAAGIGICRSQRSWRCVVERSLAWNDFQY